MTNPDESGLPGRILPSDYLGQQAWRRRVEVLRDAGRQLRTFNPEWLPRQPLLHQQQRLVVDASRDVEPQSRQGGKLPSDGNHGYGLQAI